MSDININEFTCVVCPWGCLLKVETSPTEGKNSKPKISGYSCSRGLKYAKSEQTDPRRSISGSVRILGAINNALPVKTSAPLPKNMLREAAKLLHTITVKPPIKTGDIIIPNILGTDIHFIACLSMEEIS